MKKYWDSKIETISHEEMRGIQDDSLKSTVQWAYEKVPFYRNALDEKGVKPEDIHSVDDMPLLPFTDKADLRDNYPFGMCAVDSTDLVRIHASSGTTGKPVIGPYTKEDLGQWSECMARILWGQGIRPHDICQNAVPYGLFTGGAGVHQGLEKIGCSLIPISGGMTERQILIMKDLGCTVLLATPSYGLTIVEQAEKAGVDIRKLPLRIAVFGAEPWSLGMKRELEDRLGAVCHEMFGLTELMGPGLAGSCEAGRLHVNEDHVFPEVIDIKTGSPLPEREYGELVLTSLQRRAMPILRFRTRDITALKRDKCDCGKTLVGMERIKGRADDMLIVTGVNVFPSQIESLIMEFEENEPFYQIRLFNQGHLTKISVEIEVKSEVYLNGKKRLTDLENRMSLHLRERIGINIPVKILGHGAIPRSEGKAKRVIDERAKEY